MKKFISIILCLCFIIVSGCGDQKTIDGITYDTYGILNKDTHRNPDIEYEMIVGNVVWSVLLIETLVAPVYFVGFSLYEPVGKKNENKIIGAVEK